MSDPHLELYELHGCPYCAKVTRALDDLDLDYVSHSVPASRRNRDEVKAVSGQSGVPVLVDRANGIEGMPESDDIVRYLYEEYGDADAEPPTSPGLLGRLLGRLT
jgi:glutaredoxin 3